MGQSSDSITLLEGDQENVCLWVGALYLAAPPQLYEEFLIRRLPNRQKQEMFPTEGHCRKPPRKVHFWLHLEPAEIQMQEHWTSPWCQYQCWHYKLCLLITQHSELFLRLNGGGFISFVGLGDDKCYKHPCIFVTSVFVVFNLLQINRTLKANFIKRRYSLRWSCKAVFFCIKYLIACANDDSE